MTCRRAGLAGALLLLATPAWGQERARPAAARLPVDDAAATAFTTNSLGDPHPSVYSFFRSRDGTLWLGTEDGPFHYDGRQWNQVRIADSLGSRQVRAFAQGPDGSLYLATRSGVLRRQRMSGFTLLARGLPASEQVVFSLAISDALGGAPALIAGSDNGVFRLTPADSFADVRLPLGFVARGAMVAARQGPSGSELWVGTLSSGVARLRNGTWTVWDERHGVPVINQVVAGLPGDSFDAVVATPRGAFGLAGDRWRLIGPAEHISRVLRVSVGGRFETWLGTGLGMTLRLHGVGWDTVSGARSGPRGRPQMLDAVDVGLGSPTVFVGFGTGAVLRLQPGRAGTVRLGPTASARTVTGVNEAPDGSDWCISVLGVGLLRPGPGSPVVMRPGGAQPTAGYRCVFPPIAPRGDVLVVTSGAFYRMRGGQVTRELVLSEFGARPIVFGPTPAGPNGVVLGVDSGLMIRVANGWQNWAGSPSGIIQALAADTSAGRRAMFVLMRNGELHRFADGAWTVIQSRQFPALTTTRLRLATLSGGERVLWVGTDRGVELLRADSSGATSRWLSTVTWLGLPSNQVSDIERLPNGRLALGTARGVVVLEPGATFADSIRVVDAWGTADGLPSALVRDLEASADGRRLWVGTEEGLGLIDLTTPTPAPPADSALTLVAWTAQNPRLYLHNGSRVRYQQRDVRFGVTMLTQHREDDTRYRFELDDKLLADAEWSPMREPFMASLSAGRHVARLWAVDWRGNVVGPKVFRFSVAPPWWASTWFELLVGLAIAAAIYAAYRARVRGFKREIEQRQQADAAIRRSEEKFARAFGSSPVGIGVTRIDTGAFVEVNQAMLNFLGYERDEVIGKSTLDLNMWPNRDHRAAVVADLARDGGVRDRELQFRTKSGNLVTSRYSGEMIELDGLPCLLSVLVDVTQRKEAEAALRESEARFRAMFEHSGSGMALVDMQGHPIASNRALSQILGYSEDELKAMPFTHFTHPDDVQLDWNLYSELVAGTRNSYEIEKRYIRKGGEVIWSHLVVSLVRDANGQPLYAVGMVQDVTERRRAEEALRESEQRFGTVFRESPVALTVTDLESGRFVEVNAAMLRLMHGTSFDQIVGKRSIEIGLITPEERQRMIHAFGHGQNVDRLEMSLRRLDGEPFTGEMSMTRYPIDGVYYLLTCVVDVTERRYAEALLQQSQRMDAVGRLSGGVAHDFNNLLSVIIGHSELLHAQQNLDDATRDQLAQIRAAAEHGAALTRQLLSFSQQQVLAPQVLNLNTAVQKLVAMLQRVIGEDISIITRFDPDIGPIEADPNQVGQILMNLVVNSRDAMPHGGLLTIETSNVHLDEEYARRHADVSAGYYVCLAVEDDGIGMDEATQAKAFEPFFTTKEQGKGTGLGLATVYGIVRQSGGHVWLYSEPGQGTTFRIYLPRVGAMPSVAPAPETPAAAGGNETIMLVEDNDGVRALAEMVLSTYGYRVLTAASPALAEQLFAEHGASVDLILTDITMPGMSGIDLVRRLTAAVDRPLRVVYMSGYADRSTRRDANGVAGHVYLQKPFSPPELATAVREALDRQVEPMLHA